ncbi:hypothetical protein BBK36DRAFT_55910 [Trichoderma citrinoviride]|uniref:VWFA domain-containing protein n=1 Tax=Trichoderma citrinoviride TaxID=58853 RepID=A0A2T4B830_9HYPO|nr:hypothetical protein BBK36DRAFT_55910 [Trichoderma citrinoviride]PTB65486.1 hypothetical protein BBK36DRAFT_55910 [Trichoderma citrinoviride]
MHSLYLNLERFITKNGLSDYYPTGAYYPQRVAVKSMQLKDDRMSNFKGKDIFSLAKLALHRLVFYCDDSTSMKCGTRWRDQLRIVSHMARIYELVVPEPPEICLQFLNHRTQAECTTTGELEEVFARVEPRGNTKVGRNLRRKILDPWVYDPIAQGRKLERPIIVYCLIDGCETGEPRNELRDQIIGCAELLDKYGYGRNTVMFQISQIGNDSSAESFLEELRNDPVLDGLLWCTTERLDEKYKELSEDEAELEHWVRWHPV